MRRIICKYGKYVLLIALMACGSILRPQDPGNTVNSTRIYSVPAGMYFTVDGQGYQGVANVTWPTGSKHTLYAPQVLDGVQINTRSSFVSWTIEGVIVSPGGNAVTVTAGPTVTSIAANFSTQYAVTFSFFQCPQAPCSNSPGTVYIGGDPYTSDTTFWVSSGGSVSAQAVPNAHYVFVGWLVPNRPLITGFLNFGPIIGPTFIYPRFATTRPVQLQTSPPGLQILADRTPVPTPATVEWAMGSEHTLGAVSPQTDLLGIAWVFSSWSDHGAIRHTYTVESGMSVPDSITCNYVRGAKAEVRSSPLGLRVKLDGTDYWPETNFIWGVGDTHHLEAPPRLTDQQGRAYAFRAWSNGGAASQDVTVAAADVDTGMRLIATYELLPRITASVSLTGVNVSVDGSECASPCIVDRDPGTQVKLSVPATVSMGDGTRADFAGWSDGVASPERPVTADAPRALTAAYRVMNRLTTGCEPAEGARWRIDPVSKDSYYEASSQVVISVETLPGFKFRQWDGDLSGSVPVGTVSMGSPRRVRATLDRVPYIAPAGVRNAAAEVPAGGVAPGSVVSIFGSSLAPDTTTGPDSPLAQTLGNVTVRMGERLLPLFFVSPEQINLQIPSGTDLGDQALVVRWSGHPDINANVTIVPNAPGLFQQEVDGASMPIATRDSGESISAAAPARPDERVTLWATGLGRCDRPRPDGFALPYDPPFAIADTVEVWIAGRQVTPERAVAAPGRVGVDAVTFRVPADLPGGAPAELKLRVNGIESNTLLLPLQ